MKQATCPGEGTDSPLPYRRIVCAELGIDFVGKDLAQLRHDAKKKVDEKGDRRKDYRFESFLAGKLQSTFIVTPTEGLRNFRRRRFRRAV